MYIVKPAHPWWKTDNWVDARPLSDGFRYASNVNSNWLTVDQLKEIFTDIQKDAKVKGAVLTGFGTRAFVSGADIGMLA
jgi:hypothetical protein